MTDKQRLITGSTGISLAILLPLVGVIWWAAKADAKFIVNGADHGRYELQANTLLRIERRLYRLEIVNKIDSKEIEPIPADR